MESQFTILKPCARKWTELPVGESSCDGRARFCDRCQTHVHDLEKYSQAEWDQLWRESSGHVCVVLSPPPITEPRSRRAILVGALLTMASPLFAQSGRVRIRVMDAAGDLLSGAEVALLGTDDKPLRSLRTDDQGEVVWMELPIGNNHFRVFRPGFHQLFLTIITENGKEAQRDAVLDVGVFVGETVPVRRKHWWTFWRH